MHMHSLYANVRNEVDKLGALRRTKAFLLLTVLIPVLSVISFSFLPGDTGIFGGLGSNLSMLMLSLFTVLLLPLFLFMIAVDTFTGEVTTRTLKLILVRPITRPKVYASKVLAIAFYLILQLVLLWIASVPAGWFVAGGDLFSGLLDSMKAYAAAFVPMMAIGLLAVCLAQCFNNSTGAMSLIIFIYAANKLLPFVFPQFSVWSVFSYTNWHVLWVGNGASFGKLLNTFSLLLAYCMMAYSAGLVMFDKKQV